MGEGLRLRTGGRSGPVLLLLHGLGATGDVWSGVAALAESRWAGRWLAPDLPGHGGSGRLDSYTFAGIAAAVAGAVRELAPAEPVTAVGHSLGGVLAFELAGGGHGIRPVRAIGIGIKVSWSADDLAQAAALAHRPAVVFPTRAAALDRYLRVSGLAGLLDSDDPRLAAGVVERPEGWELALDPDAFAVGAPPMADLVAAARCPVVLVAGEHDHMVTLDQMREVLPSAGLLPGLGHNPHVENPQALWRLIESDR